MYNGNEYYGVPSTLMCSQAELYRRPLVAKLLSWEERRYLTVFL